MAGQLLHVKVCETTYYVLPASLELLRKPLRRSKLKILSPFDNLLIQRKRIQRLFDFDYLLECYVSQPKRQFGYFSLPILWGWNLVARMDCKAERKIALLHIHHLVLEPRLSRLDEFIVALCKELRSFLTFNTCRAIMLHRTSPEYVQPLLQTAIIDLGE